MAAGQMVADEVSRQGPALTYAAPDSEQIQAAAGQPVVEVFAALHMSQDGQALVASSSYTNTYRHVAQTSLASQMQGPARADEPLASGADCDNTIDEQQTSFVPQSVIYLQAEAQAVVPMASGQVQLDLDGPELDELDGALRRSLHCTVSCDSGVLVLPHQKCTIVTDADTNAYGWLCLTRLLLLQLWLYRQISVQ